MFENYEAEVEFRSSLSLIASQNAGMAMSSGTSLNDGR